MHVPSETVQGAWKRYRDIDAAKTDAASIAAANPVSHLRDTATSDTDVGRSGRRLRTRMCNTAEMMRRITTTASDQIVPVAHTAPMDRTGDATSSI